MPNFPCQFFFVLTLCFPSFFFHLICHFFVFTISLIASTFSVSLPSKVFPLPYSHYSPVHPSVVRYVQRHFRLSKTWFIRRKPWRITFAGLLTRRKIGKWCQSQFLYSDKCLLPGLFQLHGCCTKNETSRARTSHLLLNAFEYVARNHSMKILKIN